MPSDVKHWNKSLVGLLGSVSMAALITGAQAQENEDATTAEEDDTEVMVVRGIRGSLQSSAARKRDGQGVVDAIVAEDIGKFPDTNLAEALQRISGVSIDRVNGEGRRVTVRGFGPEFNLVLLNGRQMPTANVEATDASTDRSFDFGNLAAEGISAVEVYKTFRAAIPTGGIGSTINIQTTRPLEGDDIQFSVGAKAIVDESRNDGASVTPDVSGIFSAKFFDDTVGVAITGSYQERESSFNQAAASSGWRGAYTGDQGGWGVLPNNENVQNRPGPNDVYATPQNLSYALTDIDQERINGQLTLQWRPFDRLTATLDYTYSEFTVETRRNDMSVWFNHGNTSSAWTDGPVAGPLFYAEDFGAFPSDLGMGGGLFAVKNENKSFGANIEWMVTDRLTLEFDYHDSSAEAGADSPFGSDSVIGTATFNLQGQRVDYRNELPVLSVEYVNGTDGLDPSIRTTTGSSFRNSFMRTEIQQAQFRGRFDADYSFLKSVDFGASYTDNDIRSAFSNAQRDTWGGTNLAPDIPDGFLRLESIPDKFDQLEGYDNPNLIQNMLVFDFEKMAGLIDDLYGACGGNGQCSTGRFTTDRRTQEESISAFVQLNSEFELWGRRAVLVGGVRYEQTDVSSQALVPIATGTQWVSENEFAIIFGEGQGFTELEGEYDYWLPAVDFSVEVHDDVILRASYSKSIARPEYDAIQGGQTVSQLFRIDGGDGSQGDPSLLPIESRNIDFSAEWYYDDASYISLGFFHKKASNFIGTGIIQDTPFNLPHPAFGARADAARAALGGDENLAAIRQWIFMNSDPSTFEITGTDANGLLTGNIFGVDGEDDLVVFDISVPVNERDASTYGIEFSVQHMFWDTGFGILANYTYVDGDLEFDNTKPASFTQFALEGLSDTANVVGFYDKDGFQVRLAWNWRDEFLVSRNNASGEPNNPMYTEAFHQLDFGASYDITDQFTVVAEGINLLDATNRLHGRHPNTAHFVTQTGRRWAFGGRFRY